MGLKTLAKLLLLFLALSLVSIYIFIPSPIRISKQIKIKVPGENLYILMSNENNWKQWLKGDSANSGFNYTFIRKNYPIIFIEASQSNKKIPIEIQIKEVGKPDSTSIFWRSEVHAGITPWSRVLCYLKARELKNDFSEQLTKLTDYTKITRYIYGINIDETIVKDTIIATLTRYGHGQPSNAMICMLTQDLRQQIKSAGLTITDSSMSLVQPAGEGKFKLMVGFPVNTTPVLKSNLVFKKMIPGKLLTGTVYGGPASVRTAHEKMRQYIMDHGREEVALPYETTVVNRCIEADTSRWITKLCYPVY